MPRSQYWSIKTVQSQGQQHRYASTKRDITVPILLAYAAQRQRSSLCFVTVRSGLCFAIRFFDSWFTWLKGKSVLDMRLATPARLRLRLWATQTPNTPAEIVAYIWCKIGSLSCIASSFSHQSHTDFATAGHIVVSSVHCACIHPTTIRILNLLILSYRTARCMIGYWHHAVVYLSVWYAVYCSVIKRGVQLKCGVETDKCGVQK